MSKAPLPFNKLIKKLKSLGLTFTQGLPPNGTVLDPASLSLMMMQPGSFGIILSGEMCDCILDNIPGAENDQAARLILRSCKEKTGKWLLR